MILTSCSMGKVVTNYCTTTENILMLNQGMSLQDVISALKVDPKDFYSNIVDGTKIVSFKYKRQYQQVPTKNKDDESFLRGGTPKYKEEGNLYVVFDSKTDKMLFYITDSGRKFGQKEINDALKLRIRDMK